MTAARARATAGLATVFSLLVVAADASAGSHIRPAPGAPDPKRMVLVAGDLGRKVEVASQGYYKDTSFPSVISYAREFENGRLGSTVLAWVDSEAEVGKSVTGATITINGARKYLDTKQGRRELRESLEDEFPLGGILGKVVVGKPRPLGAGADSFDVLIVSEFLGARTELHLAAFRVERVLCLLGAVGAPGRSIPLSTMTRLATLMVERTTAELAPRSTAPPVISGTAAVGQTLTASTGTWSGKPTSFGYQWHRCDAAGTSCVDIPGATVQTYVVADGDAGSTLRVSVTARNSAAAATARSAPSGVVQGAAPVSTSPPTITGTAVVGQTLTGGPGAWTGGSTSFAYQWQRCNAGGTSCVDLPGASGTTYVVASADVGTTLRLVVTATNAFGSAAAASAPTAVVT